MIVRDNNKLKVNSAEYELVKKMALDLYVITENATMCYGLFRRAVEGEDFNISKANRSSASTFFKKEDNVAYLEQRRIEIARWGFEEYARISGLDISEIQKKEDKYADLENLSPDELRNKSMQELEELKSSTKDSIQRANIIKIQVDMMNAKRKDEEEQKTDSLIHFYLPMPYCNGCPKRPSSMEERDAMLENDNTEIEL